MSTPNREAFLDDDGFYGVTVERTPDGLMLRAGNSYGGGSAILSPAKAREFALAILRQADAMWPAPAPPDGPPPTDARVTLLARQAVDAVNDCHHCGGGGGSQSTCTGCKSMLAALKEAGVEVEPTGKEVLWPYWRLKP